MAQDLLRVIACGSVDDGKSTLLGRLLYESGNVYTDQLAALEVDSKKVGTRGDEIDYALLLDGLNAEREQGITIDVAYRYFETPRRKYILADAPGHEQYTRNMVTGASTADVAIIIVDARKGVLTQTRRHSYIASLLGIRRLIVAVNKMDLVDFSAAVFADVEEAFRAFAMEAGLGEIQAIPVCAVDGDNVVAARGRSAWYSGPSLMQALDAAPADAGATAGPFRMPVQRVNRPDQDFRGLAGTIVSGTVRPGDRVRVLPSGTQSAVARIVVQGGDLASAETYQSVTLTLTDEVDVSRGDVIAAAEEPTPVADQFEATIVWMGDAPLLPGRNYFMKISTRVVTATVAPLRWRVNVNTLERGAADKLSLNEIGIVQLELDSPIAFEPYAVNRDLGGFILIDRISNETVAAGMLGFALRRSQNVHWQALDIDRTARAAAKGQKPCVVWFTGLSGAGKSTIANLVEKKLHAMGKHTYLLDGDNVRHGLSKDLGFSDEARVENIRRVAEVAKLMADAGLIVLCAFISPFRSERRMARALMPPGEFIEVFVDAPLAVAEGRDPKGLYRKARRGEIRNFTGVGSPYEPPEHSELILDTNTISPEDAAQRVVAAITSGARIEN